MKSPDFPDLEGRIAFILMKAGVTGPEIDECIAWAFGKDAWYIPPCDWVGRWNKLHPRAFRAKRKDSFVEFVYVIGTLFVMMKKQAEMNGGKHGSDGIRS